MPNRELLMLAHPYLDKNTHKPKADVTGWWVSEKMDGIRAFWDGGISRGVPKIAVPWANNTDKDKRFVTAPICTGLWSRYGHPICCPGWFLDRLPDFPLDGELYIGVRQWQDTSSYVSKLTPVDDEWEQVRYHVFDSPAYPSVFADGQINNPNFSKLIDLAECMAFVRRLIPHYMPRFPSFEQIQQRFDQLELNDSLRVVKQTRITDISILESALNDAVDSGAEGLMLRQNRSYWEPKRSKCLLKYKPFDDDEATIVGYIWGRETDKGSKLLGKMGALVCNYRGKRFELSGFTDSERVMSLVDIADDFTVDEGQLKAGQAVSRHWTNRQFPIGSIVTFRYRELSDSLIPKEARFLRKKGVHA